MELRLATDDEKVARDHVTFPEWGKRLTLEQYLERERELRAHAFSRGMRTWLLTDAGAVLSSCETFENDSTLGGERGHTFSVASVFTEPHHRGAGHATRMMDLLLARLRDEPGAQACVLFSDVGAHIYERSGFVAAPAADWVLDPDPGGSEAEPCEPAAATPSSRGGEGELLLHPTRDQLDWAFARERLYAGFFGRARPRAHAARRGAARACWAAYFKSEELVVLWLEPGTPDDTRAVLAAAQAEAHHSGLQRVRLWELPGLPPPHGARLATRHGELPMSAPLSRTPLFRWQLVQRAIWV